MSNETRFRGPKAIVVYSKYSYSLSFKLLDKKMDIYHICLMSYTNKIQRINW